MSKIVGNSSQLFLMSSDNPYSEKYLKGQTYELGQDIYNYAFLLGRFYELRFHGGIFTYYSDEPERFSDEHIKALVRAGFEAQNISGSVVSVQPPEDCEYWQFPTILAPKIMK